jgi:protein-S-isoprenylcysteine O-methyltransferase Ste14
MTAVVIINAICNITTSISSLALLLHVFGDPNNEIWDNKIKAWLAKIGLSVMICGATSNALTLSNPPPTEVLLNIGIALTLFWLSWWQWELFKQMHHKVKKHDAQKIEQEQKTEEKLVVRKSPRVRKTNKVNA